MSTLKICSQAGIVATLVLTAACSETATTGGGTLGASGGPPAPLLSEVTRFNTLAENDVNRIAGNGVSGGIPGTAFEALIATDSGNATYTGPGLVNVFTRTGIGAAAAKNNVVEMVGTASVTVNFETDTFAGRISDFVAFDPNTNQTDNVSGRLRINDGKQSDPIDQPTAIEATTAGNLEAFGIVYGISADLTGLLRGTNPDAPDGIPVKALSLDGEGTVDGSALLSEVTLAGDNMNYRA